MKYVSYGQVTFYGLVLWVLLVLISDLAGIAGNVMLLIGGVAQLILIFWWLWSWYSYEDSDCNDKYFKMKDLVA
jgi:hypothetical protein